MSFIRFDEQTEPATPPTGKATLYVDSVDKQVAVKDDTGAVQKFNAAVSSVNGLSGVVSLDTDDISEGITNKYYTEANFDSSLALKSTDDLSEGASNLYYTDARWLSFSERKHTFIHTFSHNGASPAEEIFTRTDSYAGGDYRMSLFFRWSISNLFSDIIIDLLLDGVIIWTTRDEAKDILATSSSGTMLVNSITSGSHIISVEISDQNGGGGTTFTIQDLHFTLERWT